MNNHERENMKKLLFRALMLAAFGGLSYGCVSRPVTYVASSKPVEQGKYSVLGPEVTGSYRQMSILFFSFGLPGSSQARAVGDALEQVPGADALVGMAVDTEVFEILPFLCPIIGCYSTKVTGTPVKTNAN